MSHEESKTLYQKEKIINIAKVLLEYYEKSDNKEGTLKAASALIHKAVHSGEFIELEPSFIEDIMFIPNEDGTKTVVRNVYHGLRSIGTDMKGVSFKNAHISGLYFNGLKNVEINIQEIPNSDISDTFLEGVKIIGTLDGAYIRGTNFTGYIGDLTLDPQKIQKKDLYFTKLHNITIKGSFDDVHVSCMYTEGFKGEIIINPQKVQNKDISGIDFNRVKLVGDLDEETQSYKDPCFDGCCIYNNSFKGCIGNVTINLAQALYGGALCNFTGVTLEGDYEEVNVSYSYYEADNGKLIYLNDADKREFTSDEPNPPEEDRPIKKTTQVINTLKKVFSNRH